MRLEAGPLYKQVLEAAYHAQLNNDIRSKDDALTLARRLIADASQSKQ